MTDMKKQKITCPVCENEFELDLSNLEVGDIVECPICGANLEVVSIDPLVLEPVTTYK